MSAQTDSTVVRLAEVALARVHDKTAQETIADQIGLLSHSPISRIRAKVRSGKARGLLASYNGEEINAFYRHHPEFREAWNATAPNETSPFRTTLLTAEQALCVLGKQLTAQVGEILSDVENGLDAREIDTHLDALGQLAATVKSTRTRLLVRKGELKAGRT